MNDKPQKKEESKPKRTANETEGPTLAPDLVRALNTPTVWGQPPVDVQPRKRVSSWAVYRAVPQDGQPSDMFGFHFVGRDLTDGGGCVSSKITSFDPHAMCGTTTSGRVYQLISFPGHCSDAEYVLNHWVEFNDVEVEDGTEEFMKTYGITRDEIANRAWRASYGKP